VVLFIFVFPLIGVVGYLIVRGHTLHETPSGKTARSTRRLPVHARPDSARTAGDLHKLADLRDRGVLTDDEFERAKAKVLG